MRFRESRGSLHLTCHNFAPLSFLFRDDEIITILYYRERSSTTQTGLQVQVIDTTIGVPLKIPQ